MSDVDRDAAACWLQEDAAYLYRCAREYLAKGAEFMAVLAQKNAAYSAQLARQRMGVVE